MVKSIGVACSLIFLQGCWDSYPEVGKLNDSKHFLKSISQFTTVYALEPSSFADWKEQQANLVNLSEFAEKDLIALRQEFLTSALVKEAFASKAMLVGKKLNLEQLVATEYEQTAKQVEQIQKVQLSAEKTIVAIQAKKAKADVATNKLEKIKAEINNERNALVSHYEALKTQSAEIFKHYSHKKLRIPYETKKHVLMGTPFSDMVFEGSKQSCKDYAMSKHKWNKEIYQSYVFASPVKIADKTYCPMFKTLGGKNTIRNAVFSQLTDADKSLLRQTATANVKRSRLGDELRQKASKIRQDHPALYQLSTSFDYRDERLLRHKSSELNKASEKLAKLGKVDKKNIKNKKLKQLTALLEKSKNYYLFESLQSQLEKESEVQPDGTFSLRSGGDFYLVEVDEAQKTRPNRTKYALIRMEHFKNKELVTLSADEFFDFSELAKITL